MSYQTVFKRYELKYMLTPEQKETILRTMEPYMSLDKYGRTTIRNIYLDTDNYRLIRRSIERPAYKEKLRIRSYARATHDSAVFVELKKKYQGIVYKRRLHLPEKDAMKWVCGDIPRPLDSQISREIDYFIHFYSELRPKVFLSYDREAYYERDGGEFRVTFDDNILFRQNDLRLTSPAYGTPLLNEENVLMELKCPGSIPLWMTEILSREHIYKTSFSKYGNAYRAIIYPENYQPKLFCSKETLIHEYVF